jgi:hypothetical protein
VFRRLTYIHGNVGYHPEFTCLLGDGADSNLILVKPPRLYALRHFATVTTVCRIRRPLAQHQVSTTPQEPWQQQSSCSGRRLHRLGVGASEENERTRASEPVAALHWRICWPHLQGSVRDHWLLYACSTVVLLILSCAHPSTCRVPAGVPHLRTQTERGGAAYVTLRLPIRNNMGVRADAAAKPCCCPCALRQELQLEYEGGEPMLS